MLDVSDPDEPVSVAGLDYPSATASLSIGDISVEGAYVYASLAGPGGGLWVVDVANPHTPAHAGFVEAPVGILKRVAVREGIALLAGDILEGTGDGAGMVIVDVSHPHAPFVRSVSSGLTAGAPGVAFGEGVAYIAALGALYAVDPLNPQIPVGVFSLPQPHSGDQLRVIPAEQVEKGYAVLTYEDARLTEGAMDMDVDVSGVYAYVVSGSAGLRIIDVSDPGHMKEVGVFEAPGARHVRLHGSTAFIRVSGVRDSQTALGVGRLLAVDVSQVDAPRVLGSLDMEYEGAFAVVGERLYAVNGLNEILIVSYADGE